MKKNVFKCMRCRSTNPIVRNGLCGSCVSKSVDNKARRAEKKAQRQRAAEQHARQPKSRGKARA